MSLNVIRDLVFPALERHGNRRAVIADGRTWSYRELRTAALEVADALLERGIKAGSPVSIMLENSAEYLVADLAIIATGAVKVPINLMLSHAETAFILQDSGAQIVLTSPSQATTVNSLDIGGTPPATLVIDIDENKQVTARDDGAAQNSRIDQSGRASSAFDIPVESDGMALIMYTGGTTGRPKGVVHLQRGVTENLLSHVIETEITASDHLLLSSPLPHSAGILALTGLLQGATVEIMPNFDLERTLDKIENCGVTYLFMVPTMIGRLLDAAENREDFNSSSLKTILYGASPISEERLRQGLRMFGPVFMQLYGQTEVPNFLTRLRRADHDVDRFPHRLRSCGQATLMASVRVLREDGTDCEPEEVGEVAASAPYVMERYLNRPEATEEAIRDGWLHTGDLGYLDADKYLYLVDRKKDMIITGGLNVYASEVEQAMASLEEVREVAVVGTPDQDWGEAVTAYVVPATEEATPESVVEAARGVLTSYKRPKIVRFTEALPTTAVGKINKKVLRGDSNGA